MFTYADPRDNNSSLTRSKFSATLLQKNILYKEWEATQDKKKNLKISGANNGKPLSIKTFNRAIEITGTKTYVYNAKDMSPVVGSPFRSIQLTSKFLPISPYTFPPKKS